MLGPFVPLAASLGRFALALARGEPGRITLEYAGELAEYDTRLLTVAALNGAFRGRVDQPVNYVNAALVAAERGIEVVEQRRRSSPRLHQPDHRLGRRRRASPARRSAPTTAAGSSRRSASRSRSSSPRAWSCSATTTCPASSAASAPCSARRASTSPTWPCRGTARPGKALMVLSLDTPASSELLERLERGRRRRLRRTGRARLSRSRPRPLGAAPPFQLDARARPAYGSPTRAARCRCGGVEALGLS